MFFLVLAVLLLGGCTRHRQEERPRNIILMIGDGMGATHVYAGMVANGGHLNLEKCPYTGFQKTYSEDADITDSGASATAMSTGVKTKNHYLAVDPEGRTVETILEMAHKKGMMTGLLATSAITHATPAAFAAHNRDRNAYEEIALDMSRSGVDLLIGGGRNHFNRREDGLNLLDSMSAAGTLVLDKLEDIPDNYAGPLIVLADTLALPPAEKGRGDLLPRATAVAVNRLSPSPQGFFLMVEGSQIDWGGHRNNNRYLVSEVVDFDRAVGVALDFARENKNTLVIVTADHETGGFAILRGGPHDPEVKGAFSTRDHTGVMVPVFAYGPGAEEFSGIYENTAIFEKMKALLDL